MDPLGPRSARMIDSALDPPKEGARILDRKRDLGGCTRRDRRDSVWASRRPGRVGWLLLAIALAATGCAAGTEPSPSGTEPSQSETAPPPARAHSDQPDRATDAGTPATLPADEAGPADAAASSSSGATPPDSEKKNPPSAGDPDSPQSGKPADAGNDPDAGGDAAESKETSKRSARKGRIVLRTVYDDQRVGEDQQALMEAEFGLLEDPELEAYVRSVAIRLLRYAPDRPFDYEFKILDQTVPNAFALPGGKIYVSRGLLALAESEDELAGVLGHEITHAVERHAAARIEQSRRINPFVIGLVRAAKIAAYGRDQERDADRGGQILAAKAGYDPNGISTFLRKLDAAERYELGWSRLPFFLSTHPTSPERSAIATSRAQELDWQRVIGVARGTDGYFGMIDGLVLGENPAGGIFEGRRFVHPDLAFELRFPRSWATSNSTSAVVAVSPERDAQAVLDLAGPGQDLAAVVDEFLEKRADGFEIDVRERREIRIGTLPAIRIDGRASNGAVRLYSQMAFVAHDGLVFRLSLVSLPGAARRYQGRANAFIQSFRPLDRATQSSFDVIRLRIAHALENETLEQLSARTNNTLELVYTGVLNDTFASTPMARGTPIKVGVAEPYVPDVGPEEVDRKSREPSPVDVEEEPFFRETD